MDRVKLLECLQSFSVLGSVLVYDNFKMLKETERLKGLV